MFHWVNEGKLPLSASKPLMLQLLSDLYGGKTLAAGKVAWNPAKKSKLFTILLTGTCVVGYENWNLQHQEVENEFDMDFGGWLHAFR